MKEYFISRTGGEFVFNYTISPSKTLTWQATQTDANWFTYSTVNNKITVSCGEAVVLENSSGQPIDFTIDINVHLKDTGTSCGGANLLYRVLNV
jgi:hypothetical protein